ncbi:MAG TPA: hypothetical protein DD671_05835 [Balneolaceae bacterium]|nr:hypothetical protein [Balneolaceae bacterium]
MQLFSNGEVMNYSSAKINYKKIIEYIAKSRRKDKGLYDRAKSYLSQINPDWDNVKLETSVLWDVRDYFKRSSKN